MPHLIFAIPITTLLSSQSSERYLGIEGMMQTKPFTIMVSVASNDTMFVMSK